MLDPRHDPDALAPRFRRRGRITLEGALETGVAERLADCLAREVPWRLACYDRERPPEQRALKLRREVLAAMGAQGRAALQARILAQAREGFQYAYQSFDLVEAFRAGECPGLYAYEVMGYLGGDAFFDFARRLTGDDAIDRIDGHATRYAAGHFLTVHADESPFERRRFAYVLGLTRAWPPDQGGLLHFLDADGGVEEVVIPGFNMLTVFAVPRPHLVSYVPPWAVGERLAVTGWLTVGGEGGGAD